MSEAPFPMPSVQLDEYPLLEQVFGIMLGQDYVYSVGSMGPVAAFFAEAHRRALGGSRDALLGELKALTAHRTGEQILQAYNELGGAYDFRPDVLVVLLGELIRELEHLSPRSEGEPS